MTRALSTSRRPPISHIFREDNLDDITLPGSQRIYGFALGRGTEKKTFQWTLKHLPSYSSLRKCLRVAADKFSVGLRTLYHWWKHYQFYDELPSETRAFYNSLKRRGGYFRCGLNMFTDNHLLQMLKDTLLKHPEHYLDQFAHALYLKTNVLVSPSSIYRCLHDRLNYRILAVQEIALQRNQEDRELFKSALLEVLDHPEMLILVDETHKDKDASRRKRAWGRKGINLELSRWFEDTVRHALIGVADFDGFVAEACTLIRRDIKEAEFATLEGSAGTVTQERFLKFVKEDLCPLCTVRGNHRC